MITEERSVRRGGGTERSILGDATGVGCRTVVVAMVVDGVCSGRAHENSSESWRRARIWAFPNVLKGDAGVGLSSASANILAALVALSADDVVGMSMSCGKNSTVRAIRSALVFVTYTVWHRQCSDVEPRYQPSTPCGAHVARFSGFSYITTLVPGGANGVAL